MNAYNPLESMKRLELAGIARPHAEAIAAEINAVKNNLETKASSEQFEASLNRVTIRLSIIMMAITTLACTVLGVVLTN
jgi:hypothetical protein